MPRIVGTSTQPSCAERALIAMEPWLGARVELLDVRGHHHPRGTRHGIFAIDGDNVTWLLDAWIARTQEPFWMAALRRETHLRLGSWDAGATGGWSLVWTQDDGPFGMWGRRGLAARVLCGREVRLRRRKWGRVERLGHMELAGVHAHSASDWSSISLKLVRSHGAPLTLVRQRSMAAMWDVTYDAIDHSFEASAIVASARGLGRALDVPVTIDDDLW